MKLEEWVGKNWKILVGVGFGIAAIEVGKHCIHKTRVYTYNRVILVEDDSTI